MNKNILIGIAASTIFAFSSANATMMLTIDDTSTSGIDLTLTDTDANGLISQIGILNSNWNFNINTGTSKPLLSAEQNNGKIMGLQNSEFAALNGGELVITLFDDNFIDFGNLSAIASGQVQNGTVNTTAQVNLNSGGGWVDIGSFDIGNPSSGSSYLTQGVETPYDLRIITRIDLNSYGTSFVDTSINVPVPATLALFGLGLLGMGYVGRRKKSA